MNSIQFSPFFFLNNNLILSSACILPFFSHFAFWEVIKGENIIIIIVLNFVLSLAGVVKSRLPPAACRLPPAVPWLRVYSIYSE